MCTMAVAPPPVEVPYVTEFNGNSLERYMQ